MEGRERTSPKDMTLFDLCGITFHHYYILSTKHQRDHINNIVVGNHPLPHT